MLTTDGELNGVRVTVQLALPVTKVADSPSEIYFDDLRIEIPGIGVLKIPLVKVHEALSTQNILSPQRTVNAPKVRTKVAESPYLKKEPLDRDNVSDFENFRRRKAK
jgi:hypothetical protein